MADIDRTYTVGKVTRALGWVVLELNTNDCPFHQVLCITEDEEDKCYGLLEKDDVIYLRFLD